MASVSTYLNFNRQTEEAFEFYRSVFGTEFPGPIMRYGDLPPAPGAPPMSEADRKLVMHVMLPILGGHVLMGTDVPDSIGRPALVQGTNVHINLQPDTRGETDRLFHALSEGGKVDHAMHEMFWGDYFGTLTDRFGTSWMFNCSSKT